MGSNQKRYTKEFKAEAVRLVRESGKSVKAVSSDIGVSDKSLYGWLTEDAVSQGKRPRHGLTSQEREDLQRLREENRVLRLERDFLKKSVAFFVKENTRSSR